MRQNIFVPVSIGQKFEPQGFILFLDKAVSALHVVDAGDDTFAVCNEGGHEVGEPSPQVGDLDVPRPQNGRSVDYRAMVEVAVDEPALLLEQLSN